MCIIIGVVQIYKKRTQETEYRIQNKEPLRSEANIIVISTQGYNNG